jgi:hypothetical protein
LGAANKAARDGLPSELGSVRRFQNAIRSGQQPAGSSSPRSETAPRLPWAQPTRQLAMILRLNFGSVRRSAETPAPSPRRTTTSIEVPRHLGSAAASRIQPTRSGHLLPYRSVLAVRLCMLQHRTPPGPSSSTMSLKRRHVSLTTDVKLRGPEGAQRLRATSASTTC